MGKTAREVTVFDANTGAVINSTVSYGTQNGDGRVIVYRESFMDLAINAPPAALKVFITLMAKQDFVYGARITKKAVAEKLKVSYDNVMRAFKWLKEHGYVKERKTDGQTEFLLNPNVTSCGRNREAKIKLWNSLDPKPIRI